MSEISNTKDFFDSRDVIARIDELESLLDDDFECPDCEQSESVADFGEKETCPHCGEGVLIELDGMFVSEIKDELKILRDLASQCNYGDWYFGTTLIRDGYFETYAREFAEDIGAIQSDCGWPMDHIDWTAAAEHLQMDYACVDFDGESYWLRA